MIIGTVLAAVICWIIIIKGWNAGIIYNDITLLTKVAKNSNTNHKDVTLLTESVRDTYRSYPTLSYINFAICSSYWEQQTNALYNMWSLQKWANITGFRILEPFSQGSNLEFSGGILYYSNFARSLRFGDYFDLDFWNNMTMKNYGVRPLENWSTYALSELRKTVVVILLYHTSPQGVYVDNDIGKHPKCVGMKKKFYNRHAKLFSELQIEAVRNTCFVFGSSHFTLSLQQFNSHIILDNVNVWFSEWRGIWSGRIPINDHKELGRSYGGKEKIQTMVKASQRVLRDSKKYVNTYLKADFNEYTAIAFRTSNRKDVLIMKKKYSREQVFQYFYKCTEEVKNVLLQYPSNHTSLSIDLGKYGDTAGSREYFKINGDGEKLFKYILKVIYGNKSIDEYHNELIKAANGIKDTGYIGLIEKTVAENGKRLIVVGGYSNFQASMVQKFKAKHSNCQGCVIPICYAGPEVPWG